MVIHQLNRQISSPLIRGTIKHKSQHKVRKIFLSCNPIFNVILILSNMADELVARNYKAKSSCSTLTVENLSTTYKKVFFVQLIPHLKKFI